VGLFLSFSVCVSNISNQRLLSSIPVLLLAGNFEKSFEKSDKFMVFALPLLSGDILQTKLRNFYCLKLKYLEKKFRCGGFSESGISQLKGGSI